MVDQKSEKVCKVCGRSFSWRKKWEKNWDEILYCSDQCRKNKRFSGQTHSNYQEKIISLLQLRGVDKTICPSEVLQGAEKQDKIKMEEVRQAARKMVAEGVLEITQKGQVVDPNTAKGAIRLRLKRP